MNVYQMLEIQSKTIKTLQENLIKTIHEAERIVNRYKEGLDKAEQVITLLQARVKQLECEALDRSWEATDETDKNGGGQ